MAPRTDTQRDGITRAASVRHARPGSHTGVTDDHVEVLAALEDHPALGVLEAAHRDAAWRAEVRTDWEARERALLYRERLAEAEWKRRTSTVTVAAHLPVDPKERDAFPGPQPCPVCYESTLIPDSGHDAEAVCIACGYYRSATAAREQSWEAWEEELALRLERDD